MNFCVLFKNPTEYTEPKVRAQKSSHQNTKLNITPYKNKLCYGQDLHQNKTIEPLLIVIMKIF